MGEFDEKLIFDCLGKSEHTVEISCEKVLQVGLPGHSWKFDDNLMVVFDVFPAPRPHNFSFYVS